jgi:hypothetical protein
MAGIYGLYHHHWCMDSIDLPYWPDQKTKKTWYRINEILASLERIWATISFFVLGIIN